MSTNVPDDVDLAEFDDAFAKAPVEDMHDTIPDGTYQAVIERVTTKKTKETNRPMITWQIKIIGPTCRGRKLWRNNVVTAETVGRIKRDLLLCGVKIDRLSDLIFHIQDLQGIALEIKTKTNGEFQNVYFNRVIQIDPSATATTATAEETPF